MKKINYKRLLVGVLFVLVLMFLFYSLNRQIQIREVYLDIVSTYGKDKLKTNDFVIKNWKYRKSQVKAFINFYDILKHLVISVLISYAIFKRKEVK